MPFKIQLYIIFALLVSENLLANSCKNFYLSTPIKTFSGIADSVVVTRLNEIAAKAKDLKNSYQAEFLLDEVISILIAIPKGDRGATINTQLFNSFRNVKAAFANAGDNPAWYAWAKKHLSNYESHLLDQMSTKTRNQIKTPLFGFSTISTPSDLLAFRIQMIGDILKDLKSSYAAEVLFDEVGAIMTGLPERNLHPHQLSEVLKAYDQMKDSLNSAGDNSAWAKWAEIHWANWRRPFVLEK